VDEAAALTLSALHLPPGLATEFLGANLSVEERRRVAALVDRRIEERLPAAYLTNEAWFAGQPYFVDSRVLVPRSPIAELIERRFNPWIQGAARTLRVLDLCTGSGCIGIACAHAFERAQVDLTDVSEAALEVAELNVIEHGLGDRVAVMESDMFRRTFPTRR
jgi:ribosomal protein L3 glutamine methyltransferase